MKYRTEFTVVFEEATATLQRRASQTAQATSNFSVRLGYDSMGARRQDVPHKYVQLLLYSQLSSRRRRQCLGRRIPLFHAAFLHTSRNTETHVTATARRSCESSYMNDHKCNQESSSPSPQTAWQIDGSSLHSKPHSTEHS